MSDNEYAQRQLTKVLTRIEQAALQAGRAPDDITLIGAAKQQPLLTLGHYIDAGLKHVGENYVQEAVAAQQALASKTASWHYIGQLQSNKTALVAQQFDWVHSVDRYKIAQRLSQQRISQHQLSQQRPDRTPLNVLIQVDIDDEPSKGGVPVSQLMELCQQIADLPNLALRGFMVLPKAREGIEQQRQPFAKTRDLLGSANLAYGLAMDTLSMGMSGDLEAAVLEGSTMVRIGTDLFGPRQPN